MHRLVARWVPGCFSLIALAGWAGAVDATGPSPDSSASSGTLETIVVTGSYIRRTDTETPSPVQFITAEEIAKSGQNTISDVIRSATLYHGLSRR